MNTSTWEYISFYLVAIFQALPPRQKNAKVTISEIWLCCVRRLCNSNRYGKDKTVVIAMGRGKRQKMFMFGLNAETGQLPVCEKIRDTGKRRKKAFSSVFVEKSMKSPKNQPIRPQKRQCRKH